MKKAGWLGLIAALTILASCGGGGSSGTAAVGSTGTTTTSGSIAGTGGSGVAAGVITGFGSIFVNGVEFDTSGATVQINGASATPAQLQLGHFVRLQGTLNDDGRTGFARAIFVDDDVEGPIASIDTTAGTFVVAGQTVKVTATTLFDGGITPADITGLTVGNFVEVSGPTDSTGLVTATRIARRAVPGTVEVFGTVGSVDTTTHHFTINALDVDYATATVNGGTLAANACVAVRGTNLTATTLTATVVDVRSCSLGAANHDRGHLGGLVTRFVSATDFDVAGQKATSSATTTYVNGTASDLKLDAKVEIKGTYDATGTLVATQVTFLPDSLVRLAGTVDALDPATTSITVFGLKLSIGTRTLLMDASSAHVAPLHFTDLRTGDYLEIGGAAATATGPVSALLVLRRDASTARLLQGRVTSATAPNFTILGVSIATTASTQFHGSGPGNGSLTADAFFAAAANRIVKVRGSWNGAGLVATDVAIDGRGP